MTAKALLNGIVGESGKSHWLQTNQECYQFQKIMQNNAK